MKRGTIGVLLALVCLWWGMPSSLCGAAEPWTARELKDPAALAKTLQDPAQPKPVIFNVGPVEQIKGAIRIGATVQPEKLEALKQALEKLPRDKEVIIYCGCCPFNRCPNIRPAFELMKQLKFKNARLLNIPVDLKENWIKKGYPLETES